MADKSFGVRQLDLIGIGTPTIESTDKINLNTPTVAISTNVTIGGILTATSFVGDGSNLTGIAITDNIITGTAATFNNVVKVGTGITIDATSGIITATKFLGDGSGLIGLSGIGSGVQIRDNGTIVGMAQTIDFGDDISISPLTVGIITVTGSSVTKSSFTASPGVFYDAHTFAISDYLNVEYTLFFQHSSGIQSQKVLIMDDGTNVYSEEYGIMHSVDLLVSVGATISGSNIKLRFKPETGVTGIVTYSYRKEVMRS